MDKDARRSFRTLWGTSGTQVQSWAKSYETQGVQEGILRQSAPSRNAVTQQKVCVVCRSYTLTWSRHGDGGPKRRKACGTLPESLPFSLGMRAWEGETMREGAVDREAQKQAEERAPTAQNCLKRLNSTVQTSNQSEHRRGWAEEELKAAEQELQN